MHPEKLGFEDCDINSLFKVIDKETQTNEANAIKKSESSVKSYKLPLPRELEKPEEGAIKVFSFCQIIQDPECPKSITIVRESVTEEVHTHKEAPNNEGSSNRYRYCKEVIKPYLKDYPPDCPDSGELLIRDAIITANEEFPEYPPCYEVPVNESDIQPEHKTKQDGYIPPIISKKTDKPEKEVKPKQSKKDLITAKKSETSKKSDHKLTSKKSDKSLAGKKSDKCLAAKKSDKNLDKKQSKKDIASCQINKSDKDTCPFKKSDKDLGLKKSDEAIAKPCTCPPEKRSEKEICSKKSDKKGKSGSQCHDKTDKRHLILCPGQKEPKICIEITDPKLCPGFCENIKKSDSCNDKRHRDGKGGERCKEAKAHGRKRSCKKEDVCEEKRYREHERCESKRSRNEEDCGGKRSRKRSREEDCGGKRSRKGSREEDCQGKRSRKGSREEDCGGKRSRKGSREEDCQGKRSRKGSREGDCGGKRSRKGSCEEGCQGIRSRKGSREGDCGGKRSRKGSREGDCGGKRSRKGSREGDCGGIRSRKGSREGVCGGKLSRKGSREDDSCIEDDYSEKSSKGPCSKSRKTCDYNDRDDSDSYYEEEDCNKSRRKRSSGRNSDFCQERERDSDCRRSEEEGRLERPRKRPSGKKSEKRPCSEDFGYREDPQEKKSFHPYKKPCPFLPPKPPKGLDEEYRQDFFPPELNTPGEDGSCNCVESPKDEDPPRKSEKEISETKEDKSSKSNQKYGWPPSIGTKDNTTKKDGPLQPTKDCLGKLLESLRIISSDAESCTRKAANSQPEQPPKKPTDHPSCKPSDKPTPKKPSDKPPEPPTPKMDDHPSENPPRKCPARSKTPPGSGLPVNACFGPPRNVKNNTSKCSIKKKDSGTNGGEKKRKTGAAAAGGTGACEVDEMVKGQLVQVQAEGAQLGPCTCTTNTVKVKSAIDAHQETLATLKCAMEDFMCKVFRSTQEAVTVITNESAKQFQKLTKPASKTDDDCGPPKKISDTRSSNNNLRRFSLVNINNPNPEDKKKLPDCETPPAHDSGPLKYLDALVAKVDSAASMISDTLAFDMPKPLKPRTFNDSSSEYDIPNSSRPYPKDIGNLLDPEGTTSMFASLRDKIWAIFIEDEKPEVEIASKPSTGSVTSESDEDLLNKMID